MGILNLARGARTALRLLILVRIFIKVGVPQKQPYVAPKWKFAQPTKGALAGKRVTREIGAFWWNYGTRQWTCFHSGSLALKLWLFRFLFAAACVEWSGFCWIRLRKVRVKMALICFERGGCLTKKEHALFEICHSKIFWALSKVLINFFHYFSYIFPHIL